jgi:hypothetical protein
MRKGIIAVLSVTALATSMFAQSKPNFSGTWKVNVAKSDFGPMPAPESRTDVIVHNDPTITDNVTQVGGQGDFAGVFNYTTDGKEATNKMGPREVKSTLAWEGSNLVVNSKLMYNDAEVTLKTVWTLSADGKTLTQNTHINSPMGELDTSTIFEKQDGGATEAKAAPAPIVATPAASGPKPNFSGTWKLDIAKSDFGILPPPTSQVDVIEHSEPALKVSTTQEGQEGKQNYTMNFTTDGKEATNSAGGMEFKSILTWEGPSLVENLKFKFQDNDVVAKDVWLLSDDGKTLTRNAHYTSPMGEMDTKFVFAKVSAQ